MKRIVIPLLVILWISLSAETRRVDNESLYFQALQLIINGQFFESKDALQQTLKKKPFHIASRRALELLHDMEAGRVLPEAVRLIASGMEADQEYHWKKALEFYRQAKEMAPDYYFLQHNLATSLSEMGQTEKAVEEFQKSLKLKENYPYTHNNIGLALDRLGRYKEAIANYQRAVALFPQYHKAYNNMGVSYFALGMEKEGQAMMKKALEVNADYTLAFQNFSSTLGSDDDPAAKESQLQAAEPPPVTQTLLDTLAAGPVLERKKAQEELMRRNDSAAIPSLVQMLGSPSPLIRAAAAEILGAMKAQAALIPLTKIVDDPEWTVRFAAVSALGELDEPGALYALLAALRDLDVHVRAEAVCAASRSKSPEAVESLLNMLNDPREEVRQACLRCLPELAVIIPRETTLELLHHERSLERTLAVKLVDKGKIPMETSQESASYYVAAQQWRKLEEIGPVGAAALRIALDFQDIESRIQAVRSLGHIGGRDALNHLYYALKDKNPEVKKTACKELKNLTGQDLKTVEQWLEYFQKTPGNQ